MKNGRIIVVDDEETIRKLLKTRLEREGYEVLVFSGAEEAMAAWGQSPVAVLVTDLKMPGKDGFELMSWCREKYPQISMIVITGHGEKEAAIRALKLGAMNYLEKPFDLDEFSSSIKQGCRTYELEMENAELIERLEARAQRIEGKVEDQYWFVSQAAAMAPVNDWLTILRRESMRGQAEEPTVLITGESGTGKEGIARMIHAGSRRGKGPWVAINCANFNESLLESELFGHERGAFTGANSLKRGLFEIAKGGTLFLDELGEMELKLQAKLLRVLQEKVFRRVGGTTDLSTDVRIIAATNRSLPERVTQGYFREDLYHRINKVVIEIPSLRNRAEDILPMAKAFAERSYQSRGKIFKGFAPPIESLLTQYEWPGNVRELMNMIDRAALIDHGHGMIDAHNLSLPVKLEPGLVSQVTPKLSLVKPGEVGGLRYTAMKKKWSESFEKEYLTSILARHRGNVSSAAREAQIDRSNFLRLLRKYQLRSQNFRKAA